ncbi:DUF3231 family protein [Paenibacillus sp. TRM 82003]|nr:DUF3231 family protein [Paenibacillus sp. TRM 82003]
MQEPELPAPTVLELGYLWVGLSINNMMEKILLLFRRHADDQRIEETYAFAARTTTEMIARRRTIMTSMNYYPPTGFGESDINVDAPKLFTDRFLMYYLLVGAKLGIPFHARAYAATTRPDLMEYMEDCLTMAAELHRRVTETMIAKNMYWTPPPLPAADASERIQKTGYLSGWFGDKRPFNSIEIANMYEIIETLDMLHTLTLGFAQTAQTEETLVLLRRGSELARSMSRRVRGWLDEELLSLPPDLIGEVSESRTPVFSERLMVCHLAGLYGSLLTILGFSLGSGMRHDLITRFSELTAEAGLFAEKVTRFLIDREWLDKPPGSVDREALLQK